ncbi:hypothetical protein PVV74_12680 [Roseovarius sp. SK2]|jgi:hypothetical protein|uniref:hypothetical protein n=1 Tax=Roseovarius TaxID=74030 RepID=UPI00237B90A5|nr:MULTISPECIES: hypothetical protein [unclassified Roseovarius]MDD9726317.1 hypothetical protein [Roseovarius sp. SK2]
MSFRAFLTAALAAFSVSGSAMAAPDTVPLTDDITLGGGDFSTGGGITVAVEPRRAIDGQLALCGVWAQSERLTAYVRPHVRDLLAPGSLAVDGQVVLHDLRVFNEVAPAESYVGASATCMGTGQPYRDGVRVEIRIPRRAVVRERDSDGIGAEIWFMPANGENLALTSGSILPARWTRFTSPGDQYDTTRPEENPSQD